MERYDEAIRNAAIDVIEVQSVEFMEDSARQIAYDFDVPYSNVKEDLRCRENIIRAVQLWDME